MADEKESAPRARPFTPPLPPFRGPATASRPQASALTPPEGKRGSLFVGTRAPSSTAVSAAEDVVSIGALAPAAEPHAIESPMVGQAAQSAESESHESGAAEARLAQPVVAESPRADAIAATEAMPWLFADPGASRPVGGQVAQGNVEARVAGAEGSAPTPPDAELALSGLPYFDQSGASHRPEPAADIGYAPPEPRIAGRDAAAVLETIAASIRSGYLEIAHADPDSSDAVVLATVLVAMLRQQGR